MTRSGDSEARIPLHKKNIRVIREIRAQKMEIKNE